MRTVVKITLLIGVIYIYNPIYNNRLVYAHLGAPFGNALPSAWIPGSRPNINGWDAGSPKRWDR